MENPRIIVSLTSYELRLSYILKVLTSIINQSLKPDLICLVLTEEDYLTCSSSNKEFFENNNIEIIIADEDIKGHKKYFYTMKKYKDDIIITIDDDWTYNKNLLKSLYNTYKEFPKCIVSCGGALMAFDELGLLMPNNKWKRFKSEQGIYPLLHGFVLTGSGVLYPPNILNIDELSVDTMKLFLKLDDHYISYLAELLKIRIVWCGLKTWGTSITQASKNSFALWRTNGPLHEDDNAIELMNKLLYRKKINYSFSLLEKTDFNTYNNEMLIVSLTSYQKRIIYVYTVLRSLLNQSMDPSKYKIVLVLSKENFPDMDKELPLSLVELINSTDRIELLWVDKDIKSHKKLMPVLYNYPNNPILVTDDDIERPYTWVETFYKDYKKYNNDIIIGASYWHLDRVLNFKQRTICQNNIEYTKTPGIVCNFSRPANGLGGMLYPPHTFTRKEFYDELLMMSLSETSDEMWQFAFIILENKNIRKCSKNFSLINIPGSQTTTLYSININKYNIIYKNLLKVFPELYNKILLRLKQIVISIGYHESYNNYFIDSCKSILKLNEGFKCVIAMTSELIQNLPLDINQFIVDNNIEIIYATKDLREYSKYYYPMIKYSYHGMMVFEGNMLYKPRIISKIFSRYLKYPYAAIGCCCHVVTKNPLKGVNPYYSWIFDYKQSITPAYNLIIDPVSPAFYPAGSLGFNEAFEKNVDLFFGYEDLYLKFIENFRNVAVLSLGLLDYQEYLGNMTLREYKMYLYDDKAYLYKNMINLVKNTNFSSEFNVGTNYSSEFNDFIKYRLKTKIIF